MKTSAGWRSGRLVALAAIILAGLAFYWAGAGEYLTIAGVKARLAEVRALKAEHPAATIALFIAIQASALALCLPGAVLAMALAAGALFGPAWGVPIMLFAVTLGDSLGFLLARHLLSGLLAARFANSLARIGPGSGATYLLALRLMAVVPYFVVNIAMALTTMRLRLFAPVSMIGLVPATILYVQAGSRLSRIERPSDIWTPPMVAIFIAIGLLPIAARWVYGAWMKRTA